MKVKELVELLLKEDPYKEVVWIDDEIERQDISQVWQSADDTVVCLG